MKLAILTNDEFSHLGWATTPETVAHAVNALQQGGAQVQVYDVPNTEALQKLQTQIQKADLVWSNAYHFNNGVSKGIPLAESLESLGMPTIGPSSETLDAMLLKERCQETLKQGNVPIPQFVVANRANYNELPTLIENAGLNFPLISKPTGVANSEGVQPTSIKYSPQEVSNDVGRLLEQYDSNIIVEECLDGREFTVAILGNGETRRYFPVWVNIRDGRPLLDSTIKVRALVEDLAYLEPVTDSQPYEKICALAGQVADALDIRDFSRFDGRFDADGNAKAFDVNGMPGLSPDFSYSTMLFYSMFPENDNMDTYARLIQSIAHAAAGRHGVAIPNRMAESAFYLD